MREKILAVLIGLGGLSTFCGAQETEMRFNLEVNNTWNKAKTDEPIVLKLSETNAEFPIRSAVVMEGKREIPSQLDDLDGDRRADELAFVINLPAHGKKTLSITLSAVQSNAAYPARVYAEMLVSDKKGKHVPVTSITIPGTSNIYSQLHHHGPALESELVAYRLYFDAKQTIDIYGKFKKGLEIKESQFYPTDEQLARGFGDDVLRVGGSCGLGALKGWNGQKATHIEPVATRTERILADGPIRTIAEIEVAGWNYQGSELNMTQRFILYAGHRDLLVETRFQEPLKEEVFCTGVQDIAGSIAYSNHQGLIGCWGRDWPVNDTVKYAKETVGLAAYIPQQYVKNEVKDPSNYLYTLGAEGSRSFHHYVTFTSLKETFGYQTPEAWFACIREWKDGLEHPAAVTLLTAPEGTKAKNYVSEVWVADQGNGTYRNPVLYADYSDPDACRVGDDFYLTSSSFNSLPGLQILHSKDLVNWTIIGAAVPQALSPLETPERPEHGNRVWAPSIRHHNGEFYIFWGDPDQGAFMVKAKDPKGPWTEPILVKPGKGIIDTCPLWDEEGKVYLVHAYAGSRAQLKSVIAICELNADATQAVTPSRIVFDGHEAHQTCEGPKFYKRNQYYYIFHPAGGVPTGWQVVLRSKNVFGPYEWKTVLAQGKSSVNGPHQGAWIDTPTGEDWFLHFQDVGAYGRLMHLQPMKWVNDWPVIGMDKDGDGCGEPVMTHPKPNVGKSYPICTPQESDEFNGYTLSPQWQWHANINEKWAYYAGDQSKVRLYSYPVVKEYKNLWDVANLLLQKTPSDNFTATLKLTFQPTKKYKGERTGLVVMGLDYAGLILENTDNGLVLSQLTCLKADKGTPEQVNESISLKENTLYLRVKFSCNHQKIQGSEGGHDLMVWCNFSYSLDGKKYQPLGQPFQAKEGKWIGAKVGMFCTRPSHPVNDGGWTDVDWFRLTKN